MANICSAILLELGIAIFDNEDSLLFSKRFEDAVNSYRLFKGGALPDEAKVFIDKLRAFDNVLVNDASLAFILRQSGLNVQLMSQQQQDEIQNVKPSFILKSGFAETEEEAMQYLRNFAIKLSSSRVKEASEKLDLHIIQSISALDELDKIINTVGTRMREWYGLHFPELDNLIQSVTSYSEIVSRAGLRNNITKQVLEQAGMQDRKVEILLDAARRSKGGDMTPENLAIVKRLAEQVIAQSELRRILAEHIEIAMENVAPNIKEILTATVGARIIAKAGSLEKLAVLPASTIQVLGAEKALFRALKTGARPPKHGLLFQHPIVHSAPKWQRGKIARAIASKVAIAARIDVYRHSGKDQSIIDRLNARILEIQEKYKEPVSEKQREKKYREHEQRRPQQGFMRRDKRSKDRNKDRKRFGRRRY